MKSVADAPLNGRRTLVRADFNVPMEGGCIRSDARIKAALPTARHVLGCGGRLIFMSHMGRPKEGGDAADNIAWSLAPVAERLEELLGAPVRMVSLPPPGQALDMADGEIALLENTRFWKGEKSDDAALAKRLAALCDVFVMDAFSVAHRAHASVTGVARRAPMACAGLSLLREIGALQRALLDPERPLVAIVGGAKISTKLEVLEALAAVVDRLVIGGGIANVFLRARGVDIGASLCEDGFDEVARRIDAAASLLLPVDARVLAESGAVAAKPIEHLTAGDQIRDIGERSIASLADVMAEAGTVIWNGPLGVFEDSRFEAGTAALAAAVAECPGFTVAGGGDTLAAVERFGVGERLAYLCTGGGAFLEYVAGRTLPALEALAERA